MVLRRIAQSFIFLGIIQEAVSCISSQPQFRPNVAAAPGFGPTQVLIPPTAPPGIAPRAQAPGPGPGEIVGGDGQRQSIIDRLLGPDARATDYDPTGYNSEGGGPVNSGPGLTCDFDGQPCCWANVPPPDDQLEWQLGSGELDASRIQRYFGPFGDPSQAPPMPKGNYLVAWARSAGPSDEAQFASCSIACASGPITVKARHWQSENVLLQVCQRESFPSSANYNPLLNCQEFPHSGSPGPTTAVLPKASLVDIVFVASNFVNEEGDIAIIDDIEVTYSNDGEECADAHLSSKSARIQEESAPTESPTEPPTEPTTEPPPTTKPVAAAAPISVAPTSVPPENVGTEDCHKTKCNFEEGHICNYKDAHQSESIRGVTTGFQVVKGQFMNRVTGVRDAGQGDYYIATFLYPREMAGIEADVGELPVSRTVRFQFYEGTHGLQLKGCCESIESCPFSSDKDVSVTDRSWKTASFSCPQGTKKIVFVCENTRTNQGACGLDDITVLKSDAGPTDPTAELAC